MFSAFAKGFVGILAITATSALAYTEQQAKTFETQLKQFEDSRSLEGMKRYVSYFAKYLAVGKFSELPNREQARRANEIVYSLLHGKTVSDIALLKLLSAYDSHEMHDGSVAVVDELVRRKDLVGLARRGWNLVHSKDEKEVTEGVHMLTNVSTLTSGGLGANSLGAAYFYGIGVPQNDTLAQHWFAKAAPMDTEAKLWMAEFGKLLGKDSEVKELRRKWLSMAVESLDVTALKTMARFAKEEDRDALAAADWELLAWTQQPNSGQYPNLVSMVNKTSPARTLTSLSTMVEKTTRTYRFSELIQKMDVQAGFAPSFDGAYFYDFHYMEWMGAAFFAFGWYLLIIHPCMLGLLDLIRKPKP